MHNKSPLPQKEKGSVGDNYQYRGLALPSSVNNHPCPRSQKEREHPMIRLRRRVCEVLIPILSQVKDVISYFYILQICYFN